MDSVYKRMQLSPHEKDQMYYGPYFYPGAEAFPPLMNTHPARPPVNYGYWPWGNNHGCGYPSPAVCHGCCSHAYWPTNHAWGSPYSHIPPFHCTGGYSIPPVPYMPPPYYAMEQPRYDCEKNVPGDHHCCGCPNHPSHQNEQRIEEEEPDGERRKNDSLVPFKFKKPYPVVWVPPDFSKNKDYGKPNNLEHLRDGSQEVKPKENSKSGEQLPSFWNGCYPIDLNNLVSSKQMGDGERNHLLKDEGKRHFPFPVFWIPYKPEEKGSEEQHKLNDATARLKGQSEKGSGGEQDFSMNGENVGRPAHRAKDIPVKKVEQHEEKESPKNKPKESDASAKDGIGNGEKNLNNAEKELPKDGARRKSPSPPKSSKLPPVCLRVDPLPKRTRANGSSRSPSPPGDKQKVYQPSKETSKVSSENKAPDEITSNEFKAGKGITKTIDAADGKAPQGDVNVETPINHLVNSKENVWGEQAEKKPKEESVHVETDEVAGKGRSEDAEIAKGKNEEKQVRVDEAKGSCKRKLSEEDAALVIQSAYRSFDVRKWECIKKLKQIAKVREEIAEVKQLIQAMESSPDTQGDSKQRNIVAETIMSLLLKLDTIQGLHPSIREVRKTVVRELVGLQEKVDSLTNRRYQALPGEKTMTKYAEGALDEAENVKYSQSGSESTYDSLELQHQNHLDGGSDNQSMETKEANLIADMMIGKSEEAAESCETKGADEASESTVENVEENRVEPTVENVEEKRVEVFENIDTSIAREDHTDAVLDQNPKDQLLPNCIEEATNFASTDHGKLVSEWVELPVGVLHDLYSEERANEAVVDAESKDGLVERLEEGLITSEIHNYADGKENREQVELREVVDIPFSGDDSISEANESLNNCKIDIGTQQEVNRDSGGDECTVQQSENVIRHVSDEGELPRPEANNSLMSKEALEAPPEEETSHQSAEECASEQENSLMNESSESYGAVDMAEMKEAAEYKSGQNRTDSGNEQKQNAAAEPQMMEAGTVRAQTDVQSKPTQECNVELPKDEAPSIKETSWDKENAAQDGMDKAGEGNRTGSGDKEKQDAVAECQMLEGGTVHAETDVLCKQTQECDVELPRDEAPSFKDASGDEENAAQDGMEVSSGRAKDGFDSQVNLTPCEPESEVNERNRKLIEENERLRDMIEKLIYSGQGQLTAISSLSGRVKDLEKRLARKRKLKMKHYRGPRSGSSCMTPPNGSPKQRTVGVVM